ncbi:FadR family transcriptional regulator [Ectothiorhodospiraceae bacterium WFHF3C12]|nr:FadR family transcriptional regulator [Ectothiorhodospiraceae bacterium WFHF3C12]
MAISQIRRTSLVAAVTEQMQTQIREGHWTPGHRIPTETQLAESFGVGRNTVREAVRALAHDGLLEVRQGSGTYVKAVRHDRTFLERIERAALRDQVEVRQALEVEAARLAARRRTADDLASMREALSVRGTWSDEATLKDFVERDARFHLKVVEASHNSALVQLYSYFRANIQKTIEASESKPELPQPAHAAHEAVVDAIELRDPDAAAKAAQELLASLLEALADG